MGGTTIFFRFFLTGDAGDVSRIGGTGVTSREVGFESGHVYESSVLAGLTWLR
jgi:hypothetical protein